MIIRILKTLLPCNKRCNKFKKCNKFVTNNPPPVTNLLQNFKYVTNFVTH